MSCFCFKINNLDFGAIMPESIIPSSPIALDDQISPNRAYVIFGISRARLAELIDSGRVPVVVTGRRRRKVSVKALQAALAPQQAA